MQDRVAKGLLQASLHLIIPVIHCSTLVVGTHPGLSIVIPCHTGRAHLLVAAFSAFAKAREALSEPSEIILVDDSPPKESEYLRHACDHWSLHYYRGPRSASSKRNIGAHIARHDAVLFLDSDCIPTTTLFVEHIATLRRSGSTIAAVVGPTEMHGTVTPVWRIANCSLMYNQCYEFPGEYVRVTWAPTSNICFDRNVFLRLGGFREDAYTAVGGEDVDIGVRALEAGYSFVTNTEAVALHDRDHIKTLRQIAKSLYTYGRADVWLCSIHPNRRHPYANPLAACAAAGLGLLLVPQQLRGVGVTFVVALCLTGLIGRTWERHGESRRTSPYHRRDAEITRPLARGGNPLTDAFMANLLDSCFDAGVFAESIHRWRPHLALMRFAYLDDVGFVRRFEQHPSL